MRTKSSGAALALLCAGPALAGTATGLNQTTTENVVIGTVVGSACRMSDPADVNLGTYHWNQSLLGVGAAGANSFSVQCNPGTTYALSFASTNGLTLNSSTFVTRTYRGELRKEGIATPLNYRITVPRVTGLTVFFGAVVPYVTTVTVPGGQSYVPTGTGYTDTVTITLSITGGI